MKTIRIVGSPHDVVELPNGITAGGGDVLHIDDVDADAAIAAGKAEQAPDIEAIEIIEWGWGFEVGTVLRVFGSMPDDVSSQEDAQLRDLGFFVARLRREGKSDDDIREAIRESRRFSAYADVDELPTWPPPEAEGVTMAQALVMIEAGAARPIAPSAEGVEDFIRDET